MKMPASLLVAAAFMGSLLPSSTMSWELGSGNRGMWNSNCDYLGQDFRGVGSSSQSCGDICADDPNCSHWTWYNGNCFLKTGNEHLTSPLQGATCGFILGRFNETIPIMTLPMPPPSTAALPPPMDTWMEGSSGRGAWAPNCDYPGQNIRSVGGTPSEACGEMCADDPKCSHWTWYNGNCWIKTGSERPSLPLRGASCGFVFGRFNEMTRNMIMPPATVMVPIPPPMGTWMVRSGGQGMWASNCDYPGQDTRTIASPRDDCGDICAGDPQCSHWAWYNGNCWIKTGGQRPAAPLQGADCGYILGRFYTPAPLPFAPVIPPPAGTWLKGSGGRSAFAYNCDLPGNDIRDFPLGNPDACGSSCADEPRCSHWAWRNGNCWLKYGGEHPAIVSPTTTCGQIFGRFSQMTPDMLMPQPPFAPVIPPPAGTWLKGSGGRSAFAYNCDLPGNDIRDFPLGNPDACGSSCADEPRCSHWAWRNGNCWLKYGGEHPAIVSPTTTCGQIFGRFSQMTPDMLMPQPPFAPVIPPPAGTWLKGSGGRSAFAYNCDLPGNDIRDFPLGNPDACGSSCADEPRCSHWAWRNGNCWLKYGGEHPAIVSPTTTCGQIFGRFSQMTPDMLMPQPPFAPVIPPPAGTWLKGSGGRSAFAYNCDLPGNDIRDFPLGNPDACGSSCADEPRCSHWAWRNGNCWLKYGGEHPAIVSPTTTCGQIFGRFSQMTPDMLMPQPPFAPVIPPPAGTWLKGSGGRSAFAYNCDLPGNDIRDFPLGNPDACGSSCADEPRCSHWAWRNGNCWLKYGGEHPAIVSPTTTCGQIFGRFSQMTPDMLMPQPPFAPVIPPPAGTWLKGSGGRSAFAYNCDLPGNDIRDFPLGNPDACGSSCADEPRCSHWAWRNGNCWLKYGGEHPAIVSPTTTCGQIFGRFSQMTPDMLMPQPPFAPVIPPPAGTWLKGSGGRSAFAYNCDLPGNDIRDFPLGNPDACGSSCADEPRCSHWAWRNGNCWLKYGGEHPAIVSPTTTCGQIFGRFSQMTPDMLMPQPPFAPVIPPPAGTWLKGSGGRSAFAYNCDLPGNDIRDFPLGNPDACGSSCADEPRCSHWAWRNGNCWLKYGGEHPAIVSPTTTCGQIFGRFSQMTPDMLMPQPPFAPVIPPPAGTWLKGSGGRSAFAYNCDLPGNDIRDFPLGNPDACGSSCADEPRCSHWAWRNGNCWLKYGGEHPAIVSPTTTCGQIFGRFSQMTPDMLMPQPPFAPVIPPPAGTWLKGSGGRSAFAYNCDLPGNDIRDFPLGNPDACGSSCADEPRCSHWTWYNGNCWMKSGGERPSTVLVGATCGFVFGRFNQTTMGTPMLPPTDVVQQMPMVQWKLINGGLGMVAGVCDFPGHDYVSMPSPPGYDCGFMCMDNPQCTHWRWYDGQCSLKVGKESNVTLLPGATCGFISGRFNEPSSNLMTTSQPSMTPATIQPAYDDVFQPMAFEPKMGTRAPVLANGMTSIEVEDMLTFINALRLSSKLQPVVLNDALVLAATEHSKDQADHCVLAHSGSDGSTPELRASRHGYNGKVVWEHISVGKQTMTEILDPWWGPTSHYDDILQTEATEVGFARAVNIECDDYRSYWTLVFSAPQ